MTKYILRNCGITYPHTYYNDGTVLRRNVFFANEFKQPRWKSQIMSDWKVGLQKKYQSMSVRKSGLQKITELCQSTNLYP